MVELMWKTELVELEVIITFYLNSHTGQTVLLGTERNINTGVLMLWNGTSGNITHVLSSLGTFYTSLTT